MVAELIKGNEIANEKRERMKVEVQELAKKGIVPGLVVIILGEDPASQSYVRGKQKACEKVGIDGKLIELPENTHQSELLERIEQYNNDESCHGILVQLPLPDHISEKAVIEAISPDKDVDGFHPINIGRMMTGQRAFLPCTPFGIIEMVKAKGIVIEGKHVVIIGRSNIVGKPVGQLFLNENATVTYCHSRTPNMKEIAQQADILVVAVGKANFIGNEYIKPGAVVIDVGVNRLENGKLTGDVKFEEAQNIASYITPVPKGVGPMTITMLLHNTILSAKWSQQTEGVL
ncbi:bifunctional methylenetetrahydrofolate dehydrogenase/methenyltetrahydrofolate cyclohydrolase FolD [Alkalihalobacillus sp. AL-G]|uniref:bifunctional methylenetetrahydrofolate dehydrogenase/methenyltetrahydrofolate cyclohydrolase FolD n=1 Tax=Alkalihalobacillus sp. AL-G TaxID=2926399 RepID=UPI00272DA9E1|nr:bifunctional methylenetetrahydrofolate dehydrogenase/methenyltetrahydrofolate cyclohydrolase FolD [Alkalihalobacillus sp. AL-G]WLD91990.1 bifunctional methylenetetrahydrofolate dehydrogenase/methenyltetrahydrofolate cyclohydrolase FolD [Alkalihalobacillus sp. AL-G]